MKFVILGLMFLSGLLSQVSGAKEISAYQAYYNKMEAEAKESKLDSIAMKIGGEVGCNVASQCDEGQWYYYPDKCTLIKKCKAREKTALKNVHAATAERRRAEAVYEKVTEKEAQERNEGYKALNLEQAKKELEEAQKRWQAAKVEVDSQDSCESNDDFCRRNSENATYWWHYYRTKKIELGHVVSDLQQKADDFKAANEEQERMRAEEREVAEKALKANLEKAHKKAVAEQEEMRAAERAAYEANTREASTCEDIRDKDFVLPSPVGLELNNSYQVLDKKHSGEAGARSLMAWSKRSSEGCAYTVGPVADFTKTKEGLALPDQPSTWTVSETNLGQKVEKIEDCKKLPQMFVGECISTLRSNETERGTIGSKVYKPYLIPASVKLKSTEDGKVLQIYGYGSCAKIINCMKQALFTMPRVRRDTQLIEVADKNPPAAATKE